MLLAHRTDPRVRPRPGPSSPVSFCDAEIENLAPRRASAPINLAWERADVQPWRGLARWGRPVRAGRTPHDQPPSAFQATGMPVLLRNIVHKHVELGECRA